MHFCWSSSQSSPLCSPDRAKSSCGNSELYNLFGNGFYDTSFHVVHNFDFYAKITQIAYDDVVFIRSRPYRAIQSTRHCRFETSTFWKCPSRHYSSRESYNITMCIYATIELREWQRSSSCSVSHAAAWMSELSLTALLTQFTCVSLRKQFYGPHCNPVHCAIVGEQSYRVFQSIA